VAKTITIEVTSEKGTQRLKVVVGVSITIFVDGQERVYKKGDLARYSRLRDVSGVGRLVEVNERKVVLEDFRRTLLDFVKFEELNRDFDNSKVSAPGLHDGYVKS